MADPPGAQVPSRPALSKRDREALNQLQIMDKLIDVGLTSFSGFSNSGLVIVHQPDLVCSIISTCAQIELDHAVIYDDRYVVVVCLRRTTEEDAATTIQVGRLIQDTDHQQSVRRYYERTSLERASIAAVASRQTRLLLKEVTNGRVTNSHLSILMSGPAIPDLTIISIPSPKLGLLQDFTTADTESLPATCRNYIKSGSNVLLVASPANEDHEQQESWKLAKRVDPNMDRTIGLLTQLEQVETGSEREAVSFQLMENDEYHYGWHALYNEVREGIACHASGDAPPLVVEKEPWCSIPRNRFGIQTFVDRLEPILISHHVKHCLQELESSSDQVRTEINKKFLEKEQDLIRLGEARTTVTKQREVLLKVRERLSRLTEQALNGVYSDDFFKNPDFVIDPDIKDVRKLRTVLRDLNLYFGEAMRVRGCSRHIIGLTCPGFLAFDRSNPYIGNYEARYVDRKLLEDEVKEDIRQNGIIRLPGTVWSAVAHLFQHQSAPWEIIATEHLRGVCQTLRYFASCALRSIVDADTSCRIAEAMLGPKFDTIQTRLLAKLEVLSRCLRREHLSTAGVDFLAEIRAKVSEMPPDQRTQNTQNNQATEIIKQMQAYYDTTMVTFVDNIANLVVENCALEPLTDLLTNEEIAHLGEDQLASFVGETAALSKQRKETRDDLEKLEAALCALNNLKKLYAEENPTQRASHIGLRRIDTGSNPRRRRASPFEAPRVLKRRLDSANLCSATLQPQWSFGQSSAPSRSEKRSRRNYGVNAPSTIEFKWCLIKGSVVEGCSQFCQTITFVPEFQNYSLEELRLADYQLIDPMRKLPSITFCVDT